jgi:3-oxoadipate enol-lactonase
MLAYDDLGSGETIVLIHGLGSRKEAWKRQHVLAESYRLIIPDLRGHGETEIDNDITMKNFANDIIELLEYLEIPKAYICGLSLGGLVAQELHKTRPDLIKGLILSNTASYVPIIASASMIQEAKENLNHELFTKGLAMLSVHDQSYVEEAMTAFKVRESYLQSARAPIGINYYFHLMSINKPILLIGSRDDKITPLISLYTMNMCNYNARIEVIENCGHLSNIEQSEKFNNIITSFLGGIK